MKELVNNIIECDFEEIQRIDFPQNERFGLITYINNVKYEFILNLKGSEHILVLGSGARPENQTIEQKQRPFFNRWSWNFEESMIVYNDPTTYLNEEIRCGWGVGTKEDYYLENISKIILEITKNLKISNENIIFYGSSVGGFMSILLSTMIKNSISIAEIPQLDISNYWRGHWERIIKYCFHGLNEEEIKREYGDRIDVIEKFKKESYVPKSLLILDCSDSYDLNEHYIPFFTRLMELPYSDAENNIRIRIDGKNQGHVPSNFEDTSTTISNMINLYFNNSKTYLRTIYELNHELNQKNEEYNTNMIKKDEEIEELRKKLHLQEEEISKLKIFRENVLNSNTWKYTESLRNISKKLKSSKK